MQLLKRGTMSKQDMIDTGLIQGRGSPPPKVDPSVTGRDTGQRLRRERVVVESGERVFPYVPVADIDFRVNRHTFGHHNKTVVHQVQLSEVE